MLALAWLNVIINEDLYDHDFVEKWCDGFAELKERVQEYTPARAAEVWLAFRRGHRGVGPHVREREDGLHRLGRRDRDDVERAPGGAVHP